MVQTAAKQLDFTILGDDFPAVAIELETGESIYTQNAEVAWLDAGIEIKTNTKSGWNNLIERMFSQRRPFVATYTAGCDRQKIVFTSSAPGRIIAVDLIEGAIIAQKAAFLCAGQGVAFTHHELPGWSGGLWGGEGSAWQKLSGEGTVLLEISGHLVEQTLKPDEELKVNIGNIAAFAETVTCRTEKIAGFKNILFGGEGLMIARLSGPGKIWLQTMNLWSSAKRILPLLPGPGSG